MDNNDNNTFNDNEVADILSSFKTNLPDLAKESLESDMTPNDQALTTFQSLLEQFNKKHDLNLKVNFSSFFDNMTMLQEGNNRRLIELYISEVWSDFRVVFFLRILQSLVILANKISSPERLGDLSTTVEQDFALIEKLFEFINKISQLGKDIGIFDVDAEITRIHKIEESRSDINRNDPKVNEILEALRKSLLGE
jgi:hypothetical protein